MIYLADKMIINYLVATKMTGRKSDYKESSKFFANFIIVDYFDWLEYIIRAENPDNTVKSLSEYKEIWNICTKLIAELSQPLTSESFLKILKLSTETYTKSGSNIPARTLLEILCNGYMYFVEEIKVLQHFYLTHYKYNNTNYPVLIIPFSFGLNRISYTHYALTEVIDEETGLLDLRYSRGVLDDGCKRTKEDLGIRTYTFDKKVTTPPYDLPKVWHFTNTFNEESDMVKSKVQYVKSAYSQYCYTGFNMRLAAVEAETENKAVNTLFSNNAVFMLNYPLQLT